MGRLHDRQVARLSVARGNGRPAGRPYRIPDLRASACNDMTDRVVIAETTVPRLVRGTRLQHDKVRDRWIVQAPERLFVLDAIALEIVQRFRVGPCGIRMIDPLHHEPGRGRRAAGHRTGVGPPRQPASTTRTATFG